MKIDIAVFFVFCKSYSDMRNKGINLINHCMIE